MYLLTIRRLLTAALLLVVATPTLAQPRINEIRIDQSGTDDDEFFELAGAPSASLAGLTYIVIGDSGTGFSGVIEEVTDLSGESLPASGFFLAAEGSFTLGTPDLVTTLSFENSDNVTHLLVDGFTGSDGQDLDTDDDGTLDIEPWTSIVDCVALLESPGTGEHTYCATELGPDGSFVPALAIRCAADWEIGAFSPLGQDDTPGAFNSGCSGSQVRLNEVRIAQAGDDDDEFFELSGAPLLALDAFTHVVIGDGAGGAGVVESVVDLTGLSLGGDGLFVAAEATFSLAVPDHTTTLDFEDDHNVTHLLVEGWSGTLGQDLDTNDDGILETAPWTALVNCVALLDTAVGGDPTYCADEIGPDGGAIAGLGFLCNDGWRLGTTDPLGTDDTPGEENDCVLSTPLEIYEIQGSGDSSPFEGFIVTTLDNVVTAVGPEGFVIQTPDARSDGDPSTSDGIYVFENAAPIVQVGDRVDVTAEVDEFFDLTELVDPLVTVLGTGALPTPVLWGETTPSGDPSSLSCGGSNFECFEGMLVTVTGGSICTGNQFFGSDPLAEAFATASPERCRRETGVEFPGLVGSIPTWDGNPELFELDPDRLGLANVELVGGSSFDATGVVGFDFGDYELWPTALSIAAETLPEAVTQKRSEELTLGSLNLFRLFDDIDDPPSLNAANETRNDTVVTTEEWNRRRLKIARYITTVLHSPDVLGVQEVESLTVLQDLATEITALDPTVVYTVHLIEGNDVGTIDVGYLVRPTVTGATVTQLGLTEVLDFDGDLMNDRPPLLLEATFLGDGSANQPFAVINVHQRSLGGIDDSGDGPRVRAKRFEQAQYLAQEAQDYQTAMPLVPLVLLGDFNAFEFTDGYVDVMGQVRGEVDPAMNLLSGPDLVTPNLTNFVESLDPAERYSFHFRGNAQTLDHALGSEAAAARYRGFQFGRANADAAADHLGDDSNALRSSDHDGFVLRLLGGDPEIFADGFESGDVSIWSTSSP